ncbi:MAG: tyrosine-type recombinase/integrase, partial [Ilumatobacteraceae bacterium]
ATVRRRRWALASLVEQLGGRPILETTRDDIEAVMALHRDAQTRYCARSDLRQFFKWAIGRDLTDANPTDRVDSPRLPKRAATPLTRDELARVIANATPYQRLCVVLGAYAGLRVSEIGALRYEDIRRDEGILVVRGGKGNKDRVVPLAARIVDELDRDGTGPIFDLRTSNRTHRGQSIAAAIRRAFERAGVDARPHDLRHTFGTEAARVSNGNVVLVAQLMGHASVQTTQRYIGWTPAGAEVVQQMHVAR